MELDQLYDGVSVENQKAMARDFNVGGLCCSYAMDWAKKKLANKEINEDTYQTIKRLKKIAKRQKLQAGACFSEGGVLAVARAYGLEMSARVTTSKKQGKHPIGGLYYVHCQGKLLDGHGFAIDSTDAPAEYEFADVGSGIYRASQAEDFYEVANRQFGLLKEGLGLAWWACYELSPR